MIRRTGRSRDEESSPDDWFAGVDEPGRDWDSDGADEEWRNRSASDPEWGSADDRDPAADTYEAGWDEGYRPSTQRERAREQIDPVVRRRRLVGLAIALAIAVIAIAVPVALLSGGGESTPAPVATQTIEEIPTTPTITEPVVTTTTPAVDVPRVDLSEVGTLRLGDRGDAVEQLQRALIALELDPGEPDGVFGQATHDAVIAFQEANGVEADGIVGEETARLINEALGSS